MTDGEKVTALIAEATKGAHIALLRRRNSDEGYTCFNVGIGGGCGEDCPVREAGDCKHNDEEQP